MKKQLQRPEEIYEIKGVYGDEQKFKDAAHRLERMLELIAKMKLNKAKILDVGCGTGYFAHLVKNLFPKAEVHGFDISKHAIKEGKKLYTDISLKVADAEDVLPYEDEYFDFIISGEHIAHLKNTDTYLAELSRVLQNKGTLMVTTPNLVSWLNRVLMLFGKPPFFSEPLLNTTVPVVKLFNQEFPPRDMLPSGHLRLFTLDMLQESLREYGFTTKETYGISALSNPVIKPIDLFFSKFTGLASGLITISHKSAR